MSENLNNFVTGGAGYIGSYRVKDEIYEKQVNLDEGHLYRILSLDGDLMAPNSQV